MTPERLLELKQEWGQIFEDEILGKIFIWRPLSRQEYKDIISLDISTEEQEELICQACILEPSIEEFKSFSGKYGLVATTLADMIIGTSCLDNESIMSKLSAYRAQVQQFESQMDLVIFEGFSGRYSLEEIKSWPMEKAISYFAQAEWILKVLRGVPLETEDSNPFA